MNIFLSFLGIKYGIFQFLQKYFLFLQKNTNIVKILKKCSSDKNAQDIFWVQIAH